MAPCISPSAPTLVSTWLTRSHRNCGIVAASRCGRKEFVRSDTGDAMEYQTLSSEIGADRVATVTINRPAAMNSFNARMLKEFEHLWAGIQGDDRVNAIVLRASEGRAFSTGADVKAAQAEPIIDFARPFEQRAPGEFLGPKSNGCWKPVVAAVHGLCCAGAFYWVNE